MTNTFTQETIKISVDQFDARALREIAVAAQFRYEILQLHTMSHDTIHDRLAALRETFDAREALRGVANFAAQLAKLSDIANGK